MKVKELKRLLRHIDGELIVIMSKDCEGNSFSPLDNIDDSMNYIAENGWSGELGVDELTPELKEMGLTEEDVGGKKALVLWPVD